MVMLIMPFYFENGYFNLTTAKARFLWFIGGILLLAVIASYLLEIHKVKAELIKSTKFSLLDISMIFFLCSAVNSGFVSKTQNEAFWGSNGWSMGILTISLLVMMYFIVSRNIIFHRYMLWIMIVSSSILYIMGILNSFHIDIFGLHENISENFYSYISTIGNVNWYVGYLSMFIPMGILLYLSCEKFKVKILLLVYINLGFYNVVICRSDGIILGLTGAFCIIVYYIFQCKKGFEDFLFIIISFCFTLGIISVITEFYHGQYVKLDHVFLFIIEKNLWFFTEIIALILLVNLKYTIKFRVNGRVKLYWKKSIVIFFMIMGFMVLNYQISIFEDSWGTKRGALWIYSCNLFAKFKWKYKLFGCGCDCFGIAFLSKYFNYIKGIYLNAHNEFLQYLVTVGLFGLFSFSMIWISSIKMFFKKREKSRKEWILFSAIIGYLGQSIVNNPQAFNYTILFLIFALFHRAYFEETLYNC